MSAAMPQASELEARGSALQSEVARAAAEQADREEARKKALAEAEAAKKKAAEIDALRASAAQVAEKDAELEKDKARALAEAEAAKRKADALAAEQAKAQEDEDQKALARFAEAAKEAEAALARRKAREAAQAEEQRKATAASLAKQIDALNTKMATEARDPRQANIDRAIDLIFELHATVEAIASAERQAKQVDEQRSGLQARLKELDTERAHLRSQTTPDGLGGKDLTAQYALMTVTKRLHEECGKRGASYRGLENLMGWVKPRF